MSNHRSLVDTVVEAFNARRLDRLGEAVDAGIVVLLLDGTYLRGLPAVADYLAAMARAVPNMRWELERVLADSEDTIVVRIRHVARAPDGSEQQPSADPRLLGAVCFVYRIAQGRIVECQAYGNEDRLRGNRLASDRLIAEQAALRRVAELVARGAPPGEVFEAIVAEAVQLLGTEVWLYRDEPDGTGAIVAHLAPAAGGELEVPRVLFADGVIGYPRRSGRPVRLESYAALSGAAADEARRLGVTAAAAAPLMVQGRPWGGLAAVVRGSPLEPGIEDRLSRFAELAATAVANAQSRAELELLADEQAALRRVAELVARAAAPHEVFDAVVDEARQLFDDRPVSLSRYEPSGSLVLVAVSGHVMPVGTRVPPAGEIGVAQVRDTGHPWRVDDVRDLPGAEALPADIPPASVLVPVNVDRRVWGVLQIYSRAGPLPLGTEERLSQFAELVAAAIANAESRAALTASRARVVAEADKARRQLARDVHDGAQRRLVHALIVVKQAQAALSATDGPAAQLVDETVRQSQGAYDELRRLAHGILPPALEQGGLQAAVEALVADVSLPVQAEVVDRRLPEPVETTAYFVLAEALTNVVKHAGAGRARVRVMPEGDRLALEVADDGRGGASPDRGSGLVGLSDRVQAAGGTIAVTSPPGAGTTVSAMLPLTISSGEPARPDVAP